MENAAVVVGVGIVAIDIIDEVAEYPKDPFAGTSEVQVIAAQLGCSSHWVGTTTDPETDSDAAFAHAELKRFGVDCSTSTVLPRGSIPVSHILASRATGSRTIVHSRDLEELQVADFEAATRSLLATESDAAPRALWFHFEGRNMAAVLQMMQLIRARSRSARISVEVEALRYDWELAKQLVTTADVAFVSKDYIRDNVGYPDANAFLAAEFGGTAEGEQLAAVVCPWGSDGVFYQRCRDPPPRTVQQIETTPLARVVESIGAGDTFIGACVAALSNAVPLAQALALACDVATAKCARVGFEVALEDRARWSQLVLSAAQRQQELM
ncbi:hypothetical protein PybrP1_002745 [[Pythium] brassicae (nom. inval.)]|nr:hypothetical protein PybrP1_002745 [[Pythium] brassicae (nom. inval.)]